MASDKHLVEKTLKGELSAFGELVERYHSKLLGFLIKMGLSRQDAEDLTQDSLIKAYKNLYRYQDRWAFSTWLYQIALNTYKDDLKKHKPLTFEFLEELDQPSGRDDIQSMLVIQDIKALLQSLKPDVRAMLLLHYYSGLSLQEIGKLYKLSADAVKMKLFRARERLLTLRNS